MPVGLVVAGELGGEVLLDVLHVVVSQDALEALGFLLSLNELVSIELAADLHEVAALDGRRLQTPIDDRREDLEATNPLTASTTTSHRLMSLPQANLFINWTH